MTAVVNFNVSLMSDYESEISENENRLTTDEDLYSYSSRIIIALLCLLICIFGSVGNSLVIIAVFLSRKLQTPPNAFVVSLAIADLLTSLFLIWNVVALLSPNGWLLPNAKWLCSLAGFINILGIGVSLFSLASISLNRYILITKPYDTYRKVYSPVKIGLMVLLTWTYHSTTLVTLSLTRCIGFGYDRKFFECSDFEVDTDSIVPGLIVTLIKGINIFAVIGIVLVTYTLVFRHVRQHFKQKRRRRELNNISVQASTSAVPVTDSIPETVGQDRRSWANNADSNAQFRLQTRRENAFNQKDLEVTKNLFIVVAAFFLCFMPYFVLLLFPGTDSIRLYGVLFVYSNSCINPVIYARRHPHFKVVMGAMIKCNFEHIPEPTEIIKRFRSSRINP